MNGTMPKVLEATFDVTNIKDTTTTIKSVKEKKQKDHVTTRVITLTNEIDVKLTGAPSDLEGFTLGEVTLKISTDQTELQTGDGDD